MQLEYAKNPVWVNAEHTMIDLVIKWDTVNRELPFTASPDDVEEYGRQIFAAAKEGAFGPVAEYIPPVQIDAAATPDEIKAVLGVSN